jgi:hypothetical protein
MPRQYTPRVAVSCQRCGLVFLAIPSADRKFCGVRCSVDTNNPHRSTEQRFWEKVDRRGDDECWPWLGQVGKNGYGKLTAVGPDRKTVRMHRVSWEIHNEQSVPIGLSVGTHQENMVYMVSSGRSAHWPSLYPERMARGEANGSAKLTTEQVRAIRARYAAGETSLIPIAAEYGVTEPAIRFIVRRRTWKHVE